MLKGKKRRHYIKKRPFVLFIPFTNIILTLVTKNILIQKKGVTNLLYIQSVTHPRYDDDRIGIIYRKKWSC